MLLRRSVVPVISATRSHGRQTSTLSSCAFRYNTPSVEQVQRFEKYGFLQVDSAFSRSFVERVSVGIDDVFVGKQETGVYPDEWYWRPEVSRPEVTRHGTNFWKANRTVASLALDEALSEFASRLMSWRGARLGNDSIWIKPPSAGSEVAFHTDFWYVPHPLITCWVALTDVSADSGTLEYVPGSHRWKQFSAIARSEFHAPPGGDYRSVAYAYAKKAGIPSSDVSFVKAVAPAGSVIFHHGQLMHGSDKNHRADTWRRSMGVHLVPSDTRHGDNDGYIYGRYKLEDDDRMQEPFFPITWTRNGYRSPFISKFLKMPLSS